MKQIIKISGEAGDGVITLGSLLQETAVACGLNAMVYKSFPSNLRGGYSTAVITISDEEIYSPLAYANIIISFKEKHFNRDIGDQKELEILFLLETENKTQNIKSKFPFIDQIIKIPTKQLQEQGDSLKENIIVLGILCSYLNFPANLCKEILTKRFSKKSEDIQASNIKALSVGYLWVNMHDKSKNTHSIPDNIKKTKSEQKILSGNKALSIGALEAGCRFYASYPITPATTIGEFISKYIVKYDGYGYQAEDEISALASVIGASFNGIKSMTATSGPGLSLMQELIGFASMIELPVVIVDVQRGGPSTGMPTKHEQSDLMSAIYGSHGESPRIVLAPKGIKENFDLIIQAFNFSEKYQCPVILLSDASLAVTESNISISDLKCENIYNRKLIEIGAKDKSGYLRFKLNETGINEMLTPGVSDQTYTVTGVEHSENSQPDLGPDNRTKQMNKRFRKLENLEKEHKDLVEWDLGDLDFKDKADVSVISWGLTASITKEAVKNIRLKGFKIAALYPQMLYPLPINSINKITSMSDFLFVSESNFTGQFAQLIRMNTKSPVYSFTKYSGEPFYPEEIEKEIINYIKYERN